MVSPHVPSSKQQRPTTGQITEDWPLMQLVPTPWNRPPEAMHAASSSSVQHKSAVQQPPSNEATHGSSAQDTPAGCGSPPVAKQTSTGKFSMHSPAIQQAANPPRLSGLPASSPNGSPLPSLNCANAGEAQRMKSVLNNSRRKKSTASPLGFIHHQNLSFGRSHPRSNKY